MIAAFMTKTLQGSLQKLRGYIMGMVWSIKPPNKDMVNVGEDIDKRLAGKSKVMGRSQVKIMAQ
jgi:hypothetical protein